MVGTPNLDLEHFSTEEMKKLWDTTQILINEEYQRSYVWKPKQKRALIESIMKGYSIGVLVIWKTKKDQLEVLDGQQRIRTIIDYLDNQFTNNDGKKFSELRLTQQSEIRAYSVYYLELMSHLTEAQVSDVFTRLQEGTPLNVAEKVNAFHGAFRDSFMKLFENNATLFSKIPNYRFKARLLAAQFLLLDLETDFDALKFPSLSYQSFKDVNKSHEAGVSESKLSHCNKVVQFLIQSLGNQLLRIQSRDFVSIYLLASYLHKEQIDISNLKQDFVQFVGEFIDNINMFSVYDTSPPVGMEQYVFEKYKRYKEEGRKATSAGSVQSRFRFALDEYRGLFPTIKFKKDMPGKSSLTKRTPHDVLKEFEARFRNYIMTTLETIDKNWWKSLIPQDVRLNAEGRKKEGESVFPWHHRPNLTPIHYVSFTDYAKIIEKRDNWDNIFKPIFKDQNVIQGKLKELDFIRNDIAHNRELTPEQETRLPELVKEIESYFRSTGISS